MIRMSNTYRNTRIAYLRSRRDGIEWRRILSSGKRPYEGPGRRAYEQGARAPILRVGRSAWSTDLCGNNDQPGHDLLEW